MDSSEEKETRRLVSEMLRLYCTVVSAAIHESGKKVARANTGSIAFCALAIVIAASHSSTSNVQLLVLSIPSDAYLISALSLVIATMCVVRYAAMAMYESLLCHMLRGCLAGLSGYEAAEWGDTHGPHPRASVCPFLYPSTRNFFDMLDYVHMPYVATTRARAESGPLGKETTAQETSVATLDLLTNLPMTPLIWLPILVATVFLTVTAGLKWYIVVLFGVEVLGAVIAWHIYRVALRRVTSARHVYGLAGLLELSEFRARP